MPLSAVSFFQPLRHVAPSPAQSDKLANMSREEYVEMFGSEGAELIMWLVMRGAMDPDVVVSWSTTATGSQDKR